MKTIAILATLDTKDAEARFLQAEIQAAGGHGVLFDLGLFDPPPGAIEYPRERIAAAAGQSVASLQALGTRQSVSPLVIEGCRQLLLAAVAAGEIQGAIALGGTQGTSNAGQILQSLPFGFPKLIVSTVANGDVRPFVDFKDITMMFSVADILGLNPLLRAILANAAGAIVGMAKNAREIAPSPGRKGVIAMTNLGVLTKGAMRAIAAFETAGYEVITFHAIGAGGRAMERMMKEGLIHGVFDYALGELADEMFEGLRAADAERLTVAASLGIPQVVVPGGAEHVGVLLQAPNTVPEAWKSHAYTFHNPFVFVPRLRADELRRLAARIGERLSLASSNSLFLMPLKGVSRYSRPGGELEDQPADLAFWEALQQSLPAAMPKNALPHNAEDDAFVDHAVQSLIRLLEADSAKAAD